MQKSIQNSFHNHVQLFKRDGISYLQHLTEAQLSEILEQANNDYYNTQNSLTNLSDNEYDILKEFMENNFPTNKIVKSVGADIAEKNKVQLPFEMASMNKIKPDTNALTSWKQIYTGPYVLSCKLDGVSGLYSFDSSSGTVVEKLYTRGDGFFGQDLSYLIPFFQKFRKLPAVYGYKNFELDNGKKISGIVVRGEFIIPKIVFESKYKNEFANARNLVAGIINRKTLDNDSINDIHFVAYEVVQLLSNQTVAVKKGSKNTGNTGNTGDIVKLNPFKQMSLLNDLGYENVLSLQLSTTNLTNDYLSKLLIDWRTNYIFDIDGIIVSDDKIYPRISGNPEHSIAFKMVLAEQMAEAKVIDVIWTASKDGYLKPRVQIEPISLAGVVIEFATGFNAAFIMQNKIGIGAVIKLIRSGDVIPHIQGVSVPAEHAKMPDSDVDWDWNATHIDAVLIDLTTDSDVLEKNITGFFKGIGVDGLGGGNVARIMDSGFKSISAILKMTFDDFLKVEGFKQKMAAKLFDGIKEKIGEANLLTLMSASNIFGRGFNNKKIELILNEYPTVLTDSASSEFNKVKRISAIKGMASKTAEAFVEKIKVFLEFLKDCNLNAKLNENVFNPAPIIVVHGHALFQKSIVMTGTRDKQVIDLLKNVGGILAAVVNCKTFIVVAKTKDDETVKAIEARKLGIPIMTPDEFLAAYN